MSKKGVSLPIETVIIIIIAVMVLALVLFFITGKWAGLTESFSGLESQVAEGASQDIGL
tara:strand:- start:1458 stop:1634 length:177 start_codon:yes stop_codon:yes gene_type:complete